MLDTNPGAVRARAYEYCPETARSSEEAGIRIHQQEVTSSQCFRESSGFLLRKKAERQFGFLMKRFSVLWRTAARRFWL